MRRAISIFLVGALFGCVGGSGWSAAQVATPDGLDPVALYGVFGAFAKRDARLASYERVRFEMGALSYKPGVRYPRDRRLPDLALASTIELSTVGEELLWRDFREVFTREFRAHSRLALTEQTGPDTLTVRAHVLDLVVREAGSPSGAASRFSRRSAVFTIVLDVRDSLTGEPLARIVDRRGTVARNGLSRQVGEALDSAGVRRQMLRWARALRRHLEQLRA